MERGCLRVDLGAVPFVGQTYATLAEVQRRQTPGTDVVAAFIEIHG
jgi:K+-sensing histidine kinase KdpD